MADMFKKNTTYVNSDEDRGSVKEFLITRVLPVVSGLFIFWFFVNYIYEYVSPFVFGYVLSLCCRPLFNFLRNKIKLGQGISAVLCIVLSVGLLFSVGIGLAYKIFAEAQGFFKRFPNLPENISHEFNYWLEQIINLIPLPLKSGDFLSKITGFLGTVLGSGLQNGLKAIPGGFINFILCLVSAFFFIKDREKFANACKNNLPENILKVLSCLQKQFFGVLSAYCKTQLIIMSMVAVICFIGLTLLKQPYALFLCVIIAVVDALPIFGSGILLIPWAVFNLINSDVYRAVGLLCLYLTIFITRQIAEPKLFSSQTGVHPLLTLFSVYAGVKLFGFPGILIGPVALVVICSGNKAFENAKPGVFPGNKRC